MKFNFDKVFFYLNILMLFAWGYAVQSLNLSEATFLKEINGSNVFLIVIPLLALITFFRYLKRPNSSKQEWLLCIASVCFSFINALFFFYQ